MKSSAVQITFFAFALVLAAALQEMSPSVCGAKVALLQAVAFRVALTRRLVPALVCGLVAGGFCDALSRLPGFCTAGFLMSVGVASALLRGTDRDDRRQSRRRGGGRKVGSALLAACLFAAVAPAGELWTRIWLGRVDSSVLPALVFSAFSGFLAELVVFRVMDALERVSGIPHDFVEGGAA